MKKVSLLLLTLFVFTSCEDRVVEPEQSVILQPELGMNCNSDSVFAGGNEATETTDFTTKISWTADPLSSGYGVFIITNNGLKLVKKISKDKNEVLITELIPESSYEYIIRSFGRDGIIDCNQKIISVNTASRITHNSCQSINKFYSGSMESGIYPITLKGKQMNVFCDMDNNDGGWTRVFVHKTAFGLFKKARHALKRNAESPKSPLYSILFQLKHFKKSGKLEFWLNYPSLDGEAGGNIWSQKSNPIESRIYGYKEIRIDHSVHNWGGLEYNGRQALMDGSVNTSDWNYAIGARDPWYGHWRTIPGPDEGVTHVELFVR